MTLPECPSKKEGRHNQLSIEVFILQMLAARRPKQQARLKSSTVKRAEFISNVDDAIKAQEYAVEARSFIEARLADLFDNPAYPAYSAPSKAPGFSNLIGRLRGLGWQSPERVIS